MKTTHHLNKSSPRLLLWVGLHKEPSLKAQFKLFMTDVSVLGNMLQIWGDVDTEAAVHIVQSENVAQPCHHG